MDKARSQTNEYLSADTGQRTYSKFTFAILVVTYLIIHIAVVLTSRSTDTVTIAGTETDVSIFAGVFSSLSNICMIFLVLFFKRTGFNTAMILLLIQVPMMFLSLFKAHAMSTLPGFFSNLFTIIALIVLQANNVRTEQYQNRLRKQAVTDILTGLPNRSAGTELINRLVKRNEKFAVVSVDLNNFKSINDTMGHNQGNEVLREISSRWLRAAENGESGTTDVVVRHGGDEFLLIIRRYRSENDVISTIRYYESVLENAITIDGYDYFMTASFGYAEFPADASHTDQLLVCADAAMYEVKRSNSSNHILRFTHELIKSEHSLEIERRIRAALDDNTLCFHLQPQYDITHNLRGFEALARMKDENGRFISPAEFIPVAEKAGLIDKVDVAVFRNAAAFFSDLIRKTGTKATLSVNVSVRHLMKSDFVDELKAVIKSCGIPPDQLEIEITESIMIESAEKALGCINEIKAMGIKIAIDDFGTGYSSLSYLNKFPADLLKVDKSFIDKMNSSDSSRKYVAAIISIGHIMNFGVISEGVEDPEQLDTLKSIGCDYIQGYIWGRPMPPEEAALLVEKIAG
ncbi:MAG: EAL domain-containing protein [Oscillospiraceae bacterium]|nr:EAL domain-containing protein [Oscillospiraceae bacterium]